jgi:hypothetical protein
VSGRRLLARLAGASWSRGPDCRQLVTVLVLRQRDAQVRRRERRAGGGPQGIVLVAVGHTGHGQVHRGIQLGRGVEVEGRRPWESVRHWARELQL